MAKAKREQSTPVPLTVAISALICLGSIVGAIIALSQDAMYLSGAFAIIATLSGLVFIGWIIYFLFLKPGSTSGKNPHEER